MKGYLSTYETIGFYKRVTPVTCGQYLADQLGEEVSVQEGQIMANVPQLGCEWFPIDNRWEKCSAEEAGEILMNKKIFVTCEPLDVPGCIYGVTQNVSLNSLGHGVEVTSEKMSFQIKDVFHLENDEGELEDMLLSGEVKVWRDGLKVYVDCSSIDETLEAQEHNVTFI